jgi:hypothetical protein
MTRAEEIDTPTTDTSTTDADTRTEHRPDSAAERLGADTVEPRTEAEEHRPETLIPADRSSDYRGRWGEVKGQFVDDPRSAVQAANTLVGEVLDELEELFRRQRADLEQGLADERTSTEDLRLALRRYHSFFDRLLSF